jgi:hypothetical protein
MPDNLERPESDHTIRKLRWRRSLRSRMTSRLPATKHREIILNYFRAQNLLSSGVVGLGAI